MGEPAPATDAVAASVDGEPSTAPEPPVPPKPQYVAYRPPNTSEYTPPASPQPLNPYASSLARTGFGSRRSKQPASLQTDAAPSPAYERPVYSPSPSTSPPLPPLPSPQFGSRQRAPSLLRLAAVSSPLNDGFPRAEQPASSPTFAPHMMRQASGQSTVSDIRPTHMTRQASGQSAASESRSIFNPLASNPVNQAGPAWDPSTEEPLVPVSQQRTRGMTNSSQTSFQPHPPLRSTTSIPDYGPIRAGDRSNLSGAYRPNRGGPNWSHNDFYPPRHFRGEETRASVRSGWTNASSSFMEASGTERSSMATGRSSISDNRESTYSEDRSEPRDLSSDTLPTALTPDEEDVMSTVEDLIDAYCYDDDDDEDGLQGQFREDDREQFDSLPQTSDAGHDGSSSYSDPRLSDQSSSGLAPSDMAASEMRAPEATTRKSSETVEHRLSKPPHEARRSDSPNISPVDPNFPESHRDHHISFLPPLQLSPLQLNYTPEATQAPPQKYAHRSPSEEIPRRESMMARISVVTQPTPSERASKTLSIPPSPKKPSGDCQKMQEIHKELCELPRLPRNKSRLSRQDWDEIQAYSKRNSKGPAASLQQPIKPTPPPPTKKSDPLPEIDEDETIPRRASTSIFDLNSEFRPPPPSKSKTTDFGNARKSRPSAAFRKPLSAAERDRYGFKKATDKISLQEYDSWFRKYDEHVSRRRNKWIALMNKNGLPTSNPAQFPEPCEKVKRYARKGYPPEWRGAMWWFYSGGQYRIRQPDMAGLYASLVARVNRGELNKDDREAIERDLDRTFPDNIYFRPDIGHSNLDDKVFEEPSLIQDLREVLSCFALNNPGIGYCQSLNFIAGLLLLFLKQDTERVFVLLTIITQNHLPGAHARSLANTEVNVLMMLIRDYLPKVWASINDTDLVNSGPGSHAHPDSKFQRQPTVALSCTSWFMSLFVGVLPIETVLRVWDAFLYEGPRALYRYALAIFKLGEAEIRKYRPGDGELFMTVQNLPRRCLDPNVLHDLAFVKKGFGSLTQNVIDQKRHFWREQNERAKRSASQKSKNGLLAVKAEEAGDEEPEKKGGLGGLRRKASKRFLKKKI